ncbi:hypothetical protein SXCC_03014 [Gluconacetobacter sp. SXCC-1]|nr:hypothetical protein SXCC_03014 [Gluconacetobacter sp. SXCC-1]
MTGPPGFPGGFFKSIFLKQCFEKIKVSGCRLFSKRRRSLKLLEKSFSKNFPMIAG